MTIGSYIAAHVSTDPMSGCWLWTGAPDIGGYGEFCVRRKRGKAHRLVYEHFKGAVPAGLQLDHLCRVRACVNPDHLEPVTPLINTRRSPRVSGPVCAHGHLRTQDNIAITSDGKRRCRTCWRSRVLEWRSRNPGWNKRKPRKGK